MKILKLTTCESGLLLDLVTQLSCDLYIDSKTGKQKLPVFISIDTREFDVKVLCALQTYLDRYLE
jgi:hypothetical protein